jgi:RNA polymerase sigma-70 factor (ECF subfamily)
VEDLEQHRVGLTGYCYRMLGAALEAEDAVQETFLRALRKIDQLEERDRLKGWLYSIATNVCFDMLRSAQRRAVATDMADPAFAGTPLGEPLHHTAFVHPMPDNRVLQGDPAEQAVERETVRLAFIAALQYLPPKQRAVLILREVLCWKADEVAQLLDTSVASVNSALQRARATLADRRPAQPLDQEHKDLVARYMKAFVNYDVETLVSLLHEDATMTMPPYVWWMRGRSEMRRALEGAGAESVCRISRFVPALPANGCPAFGQYLPGENGYEPFALLVLTVSGGMITESGTYLGFDKLFPLFDLPLRLTDEFSGAVPS